MCWDWPVAHYCLRYKWIRAWPGPTSEKKGIGIAVYRRLRWRRKAELKQVFQVCVVVKDIQKSVEQYSIFGIGPWQIHLSADPPDYNSSRQA